MRRPPGNFKRDLRIPRVRSEAAHEASGERSRGTRTRGPVCPAQSPACHFADPRFLKDSFLDFKCVLLV